MAENRIVSWGKHTGGLVAKTLGDLALLLEVDVPAVGLTGSVLQIEGKDGIALLDGVLAVGLAGFQSIVDGVESGRGGELVWGTLQSASNMEVEIARCARVPLVRPMVARGCGFGGDWS